MNNFLKIIAPIVLFVLFYSLVPANAKSLHKKNGNVKTGSPMFCQQRFNECIAKGQKMQKPYTTTPKSCAQQVHRKYYCTEASINKKFTAEEIQKYRTGSRAMESGIDYTLEEPKSAETELIADPEASGMPPVEDLEKEDSKSSENASVDQDSPKFVPLIKMAADTTRSVQTLGKRTLSKLFSNLLGR